MKIRLNVIDNNLVDATSYAEVDEIPSNVEFNFKAIEGVDVKNSPILERMHKDSGPPWVVEVDIDRDLGKRVGYMTVSIGSLPPELATKWHEFEKSLLEWATGTFSEPENKREEKK